MGKTTAAFGAVSLLVMASCGPGVDRTTAVRSPLLVNGRSVAASADTFVSVSGKRLNHGLDTVLVASANGSGSTLVGFDGAGLGDVLQNADLVSAVLKLSLTSPPGNAGNESSFALNRMTVPWTELGATYECADAACAAGWNFKNSGTHPWSETATGTVQVTSAERGPLSFDVTADVADWRANGNQLSWVLRQDAASNGHRGGELDVASRESTTPPALDLGYVCRSTFYPRDLACVACGCDPVGAGSPVCSDAGICTCNAGYAGDKCDVCAANYYRAGNVCLACGCDATGSASPQCDPSGVCTCRAGYTGAKCDACDANFYRAGNACLPCGCSAGAFSPQCDASGTCDCTSGYVGTKCEACDADFYRSGDLCAACGCDPDGSASSQCGAGGACDCNPGWTGTKCGSCAAGTYRVGSECQACGCGVGAVSSACNASGKCTCTSAYVGDKCDLKVSPTDVALLVADLFDCDSLVDLTSYKYSPAVASRSACVNLYVEIDNADPSINDWTVSCTIDGMTQSVVGVAGRSGGISFYKMLNFGVLGSGTKPMTCTADANNRFVERNETNNVISKTYYLSDCPAGQYPDGQGGCAACNCDAGGSVSAQCDSAGKCQCKTGHRGQTCAESGYEWDLAVLSDPVTIEWSQEAGYDAWKLPVRLRNNGTNSLSRKSSCVLEGVTFGSSVSQTVFPGGEGTNTTRFVGPRSALPAGDTHTATCTLGDIFTSGGMDQVSSNDSASMQVTIPTTVTRPSTADIQLLVADLFDCASLVDLERYKYDPPVAGRSACVNTYTNISGVGVNRWDIVCDVGGISRSVSIDGLVGGNYSAYKMLEIGILQPGTQELHCTADGHHEVYEKDENNNTITKTYDL